MSRLQSCHKCGAQFDVSTFAPGQQFTCGSCGAVLTAQQGGSAPAKPAVTGRAPGSRGGGKAAPRGPAAQARGRTPSAGAGRRPAAGREGPSRSSVGKAAPRGPQYRPPERRQAAAGGGPAQAGQAAKGAKPRGGARAPRGGGGRPERAGYESAERKGVNPTVIYGVGALVVAAVLLFLFVGGGDGGQGGGGADSGNPLSTAGTSTTEPEREPETIGSIKADLRETNLRRPEEYRSFAQRFLAVGGEDGKEEARVLYAELIERVAPDDFEARKFLGYTDFQSDILGQVLAEYEEPIPDSIANRRGYPYLDAVERFNERRWLDDEEDIELARSAVAKMREHEQKLLNDHQFRAADQIRANIAMDTLLAPYNYETRWAAPYLICYSSKERLSEFDLVNLPRAERREKLKKMRESREKWKRVLDEKEMLYTQIYKEWMKRYGEKFDLKDLFDEYGGRPDYGSYKSYPDGVPLVIWIFTDREAFQKHHSDVKGENISPMAAGYFSPRTSWIYLYDEDDSDSDRIFEINKNLHEGVHQLEHWFTKQKNRWRDPHFSQSAFSEGIAEFLGSVEMDIKRKLTFTGVNQSRLRNMKAFAKQLKAQNREYPVIPAERLTWVSRYNDIIQWGQQTFNFNDGISMSLFYQQSWAFAYFLNTFENGKYKAQYMQYFDAVLARETGLNQGQQVFRRIFKIRDEEDWEDLEEEWKTFVFEDLMKRPVPEYQPPKRDEW